MGQSTDAILCYGFSLGDEEGETPVFLRAPEEDEDGEDKDFDQFLLEKYAPELVEWQLEYYDKRQAAINAVGVKLVRHCSCEYPMYILAASASVTEASRGNPVDMGQHITGDITAWTAALKKFCADTDVEYKEPSWILCSDWY